MKDKISTISCLTAFFCLFLSTAAFSEGFEEGSYAILTKKSEFKGGGVLEEGVSVKILRYAPIGKFYWVLVPCEINPSFQVILFEQDLRLAQDEKEISLGVEKCKPAKFSDVDRARWFERRREDSQKLRLEVERAFGKVLTPKWFELERGKSYGPFGSFEGAQADFEKRARRILERMAQNGEIGLKPRMAPIERRVGPYVEYHYLIVPGETVFDPTSD